MKEKKASSKTSFPVHKWKHLKSTLPLKELFSNFRLVVNNSEKKNKKNVNKFNGILNWIRVKTANMKGVTTYKVKINICVIFSF